MYAARINHLPQRRLAWLLWLVLLLPLGQMAATWHVISHVHSGQANDEAGPQGVHEDHCDLCPAAAALIAGAPEAAAPLPPQVTALHPAPRVTLYGMVWSAPATAYNSRAPPLSLR